MYNLQAIIRKGSNNSISQFERLGYVGNNFANFSTNGYKNIRFEQIMDENGYVSGVERSDQTQGLLRLTGNPYDVALTGPGFIPVTSPNGEIAYTRDGSFKIGKEGYLMTNDNWIVGEGIKIPSNCYKFEIKENGKVVCYDAVGSKPKDLGTIPVVQFDSPEGLKQGAYNKVWQSENSGEPKLVKEHKFIKQKALESSNTNIYAAVNDMLRLNASMLASMRVMKVADDMYNKSINIRE